MTDGASAFREAAVDSLAEHESHWTIEALLNAHLGFIWRVFRRMGLCPADADDAAQQVFMIASTKLDKISPKRERAYLYGVALRVRGHVHRAERRRREVPLEAAGETAVNGRSSESEQTLRDAWQQLDELLAKLLGGRSDTDDGPESCQGEALDVGTTQSGYADSAAQEEFCGTEVDSCSITVIYDQSGEGNHLEPAPPGSGKRTPAEPTEAARLPTLINGRDVFGVEIIPGKGYRAGCTDCTHEASPEMPTGDEAQTVYMVTSSAELINGCCFNYGNGTVSSNNDSNNDGNGTTEAVNFGQGVIWGTGSGTGPWVMADLENGLFPGWQNGDFSSISTNTPLVHDFVTAIVVGDTADKNDGKGRFALYGGNAQEEGAPLTTMYDGIRPDRPGYVPMQKQGAVILGIGSDNSNGGGGRFYEGATVKGAATKETLDAVQIAIASAKYGE